MTRTSFPPASAVVAREVLADAIVDAPFSDGDDMSHKPAPIGPLGIALRRLYPDGSPRTVILAVTLGVLLAVGAGLLLLIR